MPPRAIPAAPRIGTSTVSPRLREVRDAKVTQRAISPLVGWPSWLQAGFPSDVSAHSQKPLKGSCGWDWPPHPEALSLFLPRTSGGQEGISARLSYNPRISLQIRGAQERFKLTASFFIRKSKSRIFHTPRSPGGYRYR
jgi:hypothetical protein